MGCFSNTTTQQGSQTGTNSQGFSNPLLNGFQNSMMGLVNNMANTANTPVYGQTQVAQNLQGLNQLTNSSIKQLQGNLARTGGLQGGGNAAGVSNLLQNKGNEAFNFQSSVPLMNYNAKMSGDAAAAGAGNALMGVAPKSSTSSGTSNNTTTANPSIMSDIGQVAGIAGGLAGDVMGMGGMGGGAESATTSDEDEALGTPYNPAAGNAVSALTQQNPSGNNAMVGGAASGGAGPLSSWYQPYLYG